MQKQCTKFIFFVQQEHVPETETKEAPFIRALVTAVCEDTMENGNTVVVFGLDADINEINCNDCQYCIDVLVSDACAENTVVEPLLKVNVQR